MKKLVSLLALMVFSCSSDYDLEVISYTDIPENLVILENSGIKLENTVISNEVNINVKLPEEGTYRIKIKDITGKLVSQEKLTAKKGDNLLKIYVKALPVSSYTVELLTTSNVLLGNAIFAMKQ